MDTPRRSPKLAKLFLKRFLRDDLFEEVSGDLEEKFQKTSREKSVTRAHINYWFQVLNYIRSFAMKRKRSPRNLLFKNNLKISWRHLRKQPLFSSINIGGLTLSITACILITLYIKHELSFDQHLPPNTYRLYWTNNNDGVEYKVTWNSPPLADALRSEVPEIECIGRINVMSASGSWTSEIKMFLTENTSLTESTDNTETFFEEGFLFADKEIVQLLNIDVVRGNRSTPLHDPMTMVITQRKAEKYFPIEDPIGKLMIVGNDQLRIDAVVANPPANSHLQYDFIISMTKRELRPGEQESWESTGFYCTYIKLHTGIDIAEAERKMTTAAIKHMSGNWGEEFLKHYAIGLQNVQDIHLHSADIRGPITTGDIKLVWLFGAVAGMILLIAGINFVNLSTARSANRAKEVGLRKTVGSLRSPIINQFLTESVLMVVISLIISTLLAWMALPQFNRIAGTAIEFPWNEWWLLPALIVCALLIGTIAGIYPAFYLSAFKPINVLKGNIARGAKGSTLRSVLVVFQFTASIILIVSTAVIYKQVDFMLNRKPGFDKEQVLLLHGTNSLPNAETLKEELIRLPGVKSATISDYLPVTGTSIRRTGIPFWAEGAEHNSDTQTRAQFWRVDHDYIKTLGITIVDGRDFMPNMTSDSNAIIINQQMAKDLGLTDPIGKQIFNEYAPRTIIGVVEDFNFESVRRNVRALSLILDKSPGMIAIKVEPGNIQSTVAAIERKWREFSPNQSIRYSFLDDSFSKMYDDVRRTGNIFTSFAVLAIAVACLGLFALSAFMIEQRGKEIAIRLLFGATVQRIFGLLTADFLKLIVISIVLSLPVAVWMAQRWLEGFYYRIELGWEIFAAVGLIVIGVAIMTVSYQSIRAAMARPVDRLRSD
jgi:putative ABC transport system permease protein